MSLFLAVPDTSAVPAPPWLLTALHLLTFVLHLAAMGTLVGGVETLLAVRAPDRFARPAVRRVLRWLPVAMAATVSLGVAPLLFLQVSYGRVAYAAAITSAVPWILVPVLAMSAYAGLYAASHAPADGRGAGVRLHVAHVLLLAVGGVYGSTFAFAERPDLLASTYARTASGWALHPEPVVWLARVLQTLAGAVALGAFVTRRIARDDDAVRDAGHRVLRAALVVAAVAGLARLGLDPRLAPALGAGGVGLHVVGAVLPLGALVAARRAGRRADVLGGVALSLGLVAAVVARHVARLGALAGVFSPSDAPVRPQWGAFALFVVGLLAAVATIAAMLRAWFRAPGTPGGAPAAPRA
jgi:hypothetical protein